MATVLKTVMGASPSRVQIPAPPPPALRRFRRPFRTFGAKRALEGLGFRTFGAKRSLIATQPGWGRVIWRALTRPSTVPAGTGQLNQLRMLGSGAITAARTPASTTSEWGSFACAGLAMTWSQRRIGAKYQVDAFSKTKPSLKIAPTR